MHFKIWKMRKQKLNINITNVMSQKCYFGFIRVNITKTLVHCWNSTRSRLRFRTALSCRVLRGYTTLWSIVLQCHNFRSFFFLYGWQNRGFYPENKDNICVKRQKNTNLSKISINSDLGSTSIGNICPLTKKIYFSFVIALHFQRIKYF